jgi:uncharacterized protein
MQIAILSDIHDHIAKLASALDQVRGADALICCGDLCSPFIARQLGEGFAGPIHIVFGNNDGDLFRIGAMASRFPQITLHGELARLELGGRRIAVNHYPEIASSIADSRAFDLVCYGHNHLYAVERRGDALLVNPGEVMGELTGAATCAVYDSAAHAVTRHDI